MGELRKTQQTGQLYYGTVNETITLDTVDRTITLDIADGIVTLGHNR